ncbi:hypothetical protein R3P38DRAFT_2925659, partial [Favolaschia claudopus]
MSRVPTFPPRRRGVGLRTMLGIVLPVQAEADLTWTSVDYVPHKGFSEELAIMTSPYGSLPTIASSSALSVVTPHPS